MKSVAEAPSKAIITGEHFVVHGAWALASALPMKVRVEVEAAPALEVRSDRFRSGAPELIPVARVVEELAAKHSVSPKVLVKIRSEIPEGAGLGSSAATTVATAAAFLRLNSHRVGLGEVVKASMVGEGEIHGRPSGIDPAICATGGVILFRMGARKKRVEMKVRRSLIIAHSGLRRPTRSQIRAVSGVRDARPRFFRAVADSVSEISIEAAEDLARGDMRALGRLMTFNHLALSSIGVSNERLDRLVEDCLSLGSYGAKLTGAGGGGSVVAVAPKAKEKSIVSRLRRGGFETFRATIPVPGVRSWLEP